MSLHQVPGESQDFLVWKLTSEGKATLRSAHLLLSNLNENDKDTVWKLMWKWSGPQWVKTFLWLVNHDKILTNVERRRRHLYILSLCELCNLKYEASLHALRDCHAAAYVWKRLIPPERINAFFNENSSKCWLRWNLELVMNTRAGVF